MPLYVYLNRIRRLDDLIRRKSTGPPKELAAKLDISERWLYVLLDELRNELGCPIEYDRRRRSYIYGEDGKIRIGFTREMTPGELKRINGKINFKIFRSLYL
jgi:hypothetical protein